MGRHTFFVLIALTIVWIVLLEGISWQAVAMGMMSSLICMHMCGKFLPRAEIEDVNFYKLIGFPFFLLGQIYAAGFDVMRLVVMGYKVDIFKSKTELKSEALRIILGECITIVPGSILLDLKDDDTTILWLTAPHGGMDEETAEEYLKGKLERRLIKAQRYAAPKDCG